MAAYADEARRLRSNLDGASEEKKVSPLETKGEGGHGEEKLSWLSLFRLSCSLPKEVYVHLGTCFQVSRTPLLRPWTEVWAVSLGPTASHPQVLHYGRVFIHLSIHVREVYVRRVSEADVEH